MLSLKKFVIGDWNKVRGYLLEDLQDIESQINQQQGQLFSSQTTGGNQIKASAIPTAAIVAIIKANPPYSAGAQLELWALAGGL